jgi:hypothetical protein
MGRQMDEKCAVITKQTSSIENISAPNKTGILIALSVGPRAGGGVEGHKQSLWPFLVCRTISVERNAASSD